MLQRGFLRDPGQLRFLSASPRRTEQTRSQTPDLIRVLARWFERIEIRADAHAVTITATRRKASAPAAVTLAIDRSSWARSAPPSSRQLNPPIRWARSEVIGTIQAFADQHGRPPLQSEWRSAHGEHATDRYAARLFGSWQKAVRAAGYTPVLPARHRWSDEEVLDAIRAWHREHGSSPRSVDWKPASPGHPSSTLITTRFGGFPNARRLAGVPAPLARTRRDPWSDREIHEALRSWVALHGTVPRSREWERAHRDRPTSLFLRRRFGNWASALEAFGFEPKHPAHFHERWDRERIVAALATWAREHGRRPTRRDFDRAGGALPSSFTIHRRFGTLRAALLAAGLPTELPGASG